jgi:hypothetical protein
MKTLCAVLLLITCAIAQNGKPIKQFIPGDMMLSKVTLKTKIDLAIYGARFGRDLMLDPESFRVSRVFVVGNGNVCMEFRSKNSMGGYVQSAGVYSDGGKFSQYTGEPEPNSDGSDSFSYIGSDRYHANQDFEYSCLPLSTKYSKPVDVTDQVKSALKSDRNKD